MAHLKACTKPVHAMLFIFTQVVGFGGKPGFFFWQNFKNSRWKKLKEKKTQAKIWPKTQRTGASEPNVAPKLKILKTQAAFFCRWRWNLGRRTDKSAGQIHTDVKTPHAVSHQPNDKRRRGQRWRLRICTSGLWHKVHELEESIYQAFFFERLSGIQQNY